MTDRHKTPLLAWHPPGEQSAQVRAEAQRRGVRLSSVLNEMLADWLAKIDAERAGARAETPRKRAAKPQGTPTAAALAQERARDRREDAASHRCPVKGWCVTCGEMKGPRR